LGPRSVRQHSFEITFHLRHVKVKLFWFTFHFVEDLARWLFIWKFAR